MTPTRVGIARGIVNRSAWMQADVYGHGPSLKEFMRDTPVSADRDTYENERESTKMDQLELVVVAAGLRRPSSTRMLADRLAEATERGLREQDRDVDVRVIELREFAADIADHMVAGFPSARLAEVVNAVEGADGLIVVSPIFSASYSGLFKSFFDVLDNKALAGKPVLIAAAGGSARHSLVLEHALRPLFSYLRAIVMPTGVYAATQDWGASSTDQVPSLGDRIERAAGELSGLLGGRPPALKPASAEETVVSFDQLLAG